MPHQQLLCSHLSHPRLDELQREAEIQARKLEMQLAEEEAREARLRAEEYNRRIAEQERKKYA